MSSPVSSQCVRAERVVDDGMAAGECLSGYVGLRAETLPRADRSVAESHGVSPASDTDYPEPIVLHGGGVCLAVLAVDFLGGHRCASVYGMRAARRMADRMRVRSQYGMWVASCISPSSRSPMSVSGGIAYSMSYALPRRSFWSASISCISFSSIGIISLLFFMALLIVYIYMSSAILFLLFFMLFVTYHEY